MYSTCQKEGAEAPPKAGGLSSAPLMGETEEPRGGLVYNWSQDTEHPSGWQGWLGPRGWAVLGLSLNQEPGVGTAQSSLSLGVNSSHKERGWGPRKRPPRQMVGQHGQCYGSMPLSSTFQRFESASPGPRMTSFTQEDTHLGTFMPGRDGDRQGGS